MLRNLFARRYSVMFLWTISYFVVLILPILINSAANFETERLVTNEIINYNSTQIKQLRQNIDKVLVDVNRISDEIIVNTSIRDLLGKSTDVEAETTMQIIGICDTLKKYKLPENNIDDIYIYFPAIDMVTTPAAASASKSFFDAYYGNSDLTYEKWKEYFCGNYKGTYLALQTVSPDGQESRKIIYRKTFSPLMGMAEKANIIIILDEVQLLSQMTDVQQLNKGTVFIIDSTNQILASTGDEGLGNSFKYEDIPDKSGTFYTTIHENKMIVTYNKSEVTRWKYTHVVANGVYWDKVIYLRNITYASLFLCLLFGGIIAMIFMKKNYNPIRQLIKIIGINNEINYEKKHNEYTYIQEKIRKTLDEKQVIHQKLAQQNKLLKSYFLLKLLKGVETSSMPVYDTLSSLEIQFDTDYFGVVVFNFNKPENNGYGDKDLDKIEDDSLQRFIVSNVFEELICIRNNGYMLEVDDMVACLINLRESSVDEWKAEIHKIVKETLEFLDKHYHFQPIVSSSCLHQSLIGVSTAYNEALEVMEYIKVLGMTDIMFYDEINSYSDDDYYYPLEKEQQIINLVKSSEYAKIKIILDEIFQRNFSEKKLPLYASKCLVFDLISTILKAMNHLEEAEKKELTVDLSLIEQHAQSESIVDMRKHITAILKKICNVIYQRKQNNRDSIANRVNEHIEANYQDVNMSISGIAEYFGLHPVYLSKEFKEKSGESMLDVINKVRVNKAKELLTNNKYNLEEIANHTGYFNVRTFTRAFVKIEGVTPGKYRESIKI